LRSEIRKVINLLNNTFKSTTNEIRSTAEEVLEEGANGKSPTISAPERPLLRQRNSQMAKSMSAVLGGGM
jgi:hypothetical protein